MAVRDTDVDESPSVRRPTGWRSVYRQLKQDLTARISLYIVLVVLFVGAYTFIDSYLSYLTFGRLPNYWFAELIPIFDHPNALPPPGEGQTHLPPAFTAEGTWEHPLGTDPRGRDYLTRLVYGTQVSLTVGLVSTTIGAVGGTIIGSVSGYYGGRVDDVLMRLVETIFAIPALILVIVITVFLSGGTTDIRYAVLAIGIVMIPIFSRIIRSNVLSVRELGYIEAAKAAGVRDRTIILRHVIPNSIAPLMVYWTLQIGGVILIVAGLSFLGYGAQPPTADWGQMLNVSHGFMHSNIWLSIWPGLAIMFTIMGFNLLGDGLQDALDPRINQ